ncbi:helix-turn-helix domain-containing protein [Streptomyces sp. NPDC048564]|uniref:helix-turn-helix domain-containing protein n=1 Tax=Streptomyces sp. NPDC048564 TaxID=3155760 RepID=UPI0034306438
MTIALSNDPARFARELNSAQRAELKVIADELVQQRSEIRPTSDTGRELISAAEAAAILGVSPRTVTRRAFQLGGVQIGGRWLVDKERVMRHQKG